MSTPFGSTPSQQDQFTLPRGEILGRYESYLDAQKVVDYLADNDFPVANVSIIGCDLKSVERVTAKLSYPRVALSGAAQGAMFGIFVGLLLSLFTAGNPISQLLSSVGLGMAIWMIVGVVGYSLRRGKRDFASSSQIMAGYYDVVVAFEHAHAARNLASSLPMSRVQAGSVTPAWAPRDNGTPRDQGGSRDPRGPASAPTAQSPSPSADAEQQASAPASRPRSGYEDLPDGRPRFGARREPEAPNPGSAPSEAASTEAPQPGRQQTEESGSEASQSGEHRADEQRVDEQRVDEQRTGESRTDER